MQSGQDNEFDPATVFCLFRIPKKGGRVIWEVTNSCNYGCRYCIFSSTSRKPKEELDTQQIKTVIDALVENGFTHIKITGGEPFMRPDLLEILGYISQRGLKTDLSTNASMITPEIAAALSLMDLEMVHVSLDGHTQNMQEAVRGKKTFEPTINGIHHLTARNIYVRIGCVIYKGNQESLEEIVEYCAGLGADEVVFSLMEPVGRMRGKTDLVCDQPTVLLHSTLQEITQRFSDAIKVSYNFAASERSSSCSSCPGGERFLFIDHKGNISPCTWVAEHRSDYISEHSLHTHTLTDLLQAPRNLLFRERVQELAKSGLERCPMQLVPQFKEAEIIHELFESTPDISLCSGDKYKLLSPIYPFATENIAGYFPLLNLEGKSVLTVGGSGDHAINAYLNGAASVDCFDINLLAKYYAELKFIALQQWDLEAFKRFFMQGPQALDWPLYNKLRSQLSLEARYFFDKAYDYFHQAGANFRKSDFFRLNYDVEQKNIANNLYLASDDAFKAARAKQKTISNWYTKSLQDLDLEGNYDYIILSNIADYAHRLFEGDYLEVFSNHLTKLASKLTPSGQIIAAYIYDYDDVYGSSARSRINQVEQRKASFSRIDDLVYEEIPIPSAISPDTRDAVAIVRKK